MLNGRLLQLPGPTLAVLLAANVAAAVQEPPVPPVPPAAAVAGQQGDAASRSATVAPRAVAPACETEATGSAFQRWRQRRKAVRQDRMSGYPEEFQRPPVGMMLHGLTEQQRQSGRNARMILHNFDFAPGSTALNDRGHARLARICEWLPGTPGRLLIEASPEGTELDDARRLSVFHAMEELSCPLPLTAIQTTAQTPGLDSDSARSIYENQQKQTRSKGVGVGGGSLISSPPATPQ
jgi:hypothetical protein